MRVALALALLLVAAVPADAARNGKCPRSPHVALRTSAAVIYDDREEVYGCVKRVGRLVHVADYPFDGTLEWRAAGRFVAAAATECDRYVGDCAGALITVTDLRSGREVSRDQLWSERIAFDDLEVGTAGRVVYTAHDVDSGVVEAWLVDRDRERLVARGEEGDPRLLYNAHHVTLWVGERAVRVRVDRR